MKAYYSQKELSNMTFEQRLALAVQYCALINEASDVRNDAANIFSISYEDYNRIASALDFQ